MMKKQKFFLPLLLLFCSCSNDIYMPYASDKTNAPGFGGANEAKFDASVASHNNISMDAAYAPIDHIGVIVSYRSINFNSGYNVSSDSQAVGEISKTMTGYRSDIGLGYFTRFNDIGRFEVYCGYGMGKQSLHRSFVDPNGNGLTDHYVSIPYNRCFLQWGAGFDGRIFSLMAGFRMAYHFPGPAYYPSYSATATNLIIDDPFHFLPYIDLRIGYKFIKFTTQLGWSVSSLSFYTNNTLQTATGNPIPMPYISAGLVFHFKPEYFGSGNVR